MNGATPRPHIASSKPFYCELKPNRRIAWCRCGRSTRQPFCDGRSHLGTGFEPLLYCAGDQPEEVLLCGCKQTATPPFCDGSHNNLPDGYASEENSEEPRRPVPRSEPDSEGVKRLDGTCYVVTAAAGDFEVKDGFRLRPIIAPSLGALHQSQFYLELGEGVSPIFCANDSDVILFVAQGAGMVQIAGRRFGVGERDGIYVRPRESFQFTTEERIRVFVSALPGLDALDQLELHSTHFDTAHPERVCPVDPAKRSEMGPRFFQMLVDRNIGSTNAVQFIGHIPRSRAAMHRHLYEEALIILSGEGILWTEESCATVAAGDVVFLPRKQAHSLECTDDAGMDVVGVIHPGDNPAINY